MLDIIGNLKIDETKPERIKYLIACIRSYGFLKDTCRFVLNLQGASEELLEIVKNELKGFDAYLSADLDPDYGNVYIRLTTKGWAHKHNYILNFMEDHFYMLDSEVAMRDVLEKMQTHNVDICKASFFDIERNSISKIPIGSVKISFKNFNGHSIFHNTEYFHKCYQAHYGSRYYIGVNFIVSRAFASKFWRYSHGQRPHDYEIPRYNKDLEHNVMFPAYEITCSIDDDHGEPNTCLLNRTDCQKWNTIWQQVNAEYGNDPIRIKSIVKAEPPQEIYLKLNPEYSGWKKYFQDYGLISYQLLADDKVKLSYHIRSNLWIIIVEMGMNVPLFIGTINTKDELDVITNSVGFFDKKKIPNVIEFS